MKGIIYTILVICLIVAFSFLIQAKVKQTNSMNGLLDLKCEEAYYKTLNTNQKAKELNLSYDDDMEILRKICGNKQIDTLMQGQE